MKLSSLAEGETVRNKNPDRKVGEFYLNVKKTKNVVFFKGYRSPTSQKEKEVDVKLAVDIVDYAHLNLYDGLYLFSGDADIMHSIKVASRLNKIVNILALPNRIPHRFVYLYPTHILQVLETNKFAKSNKPLGYQARLLKVSGVVAQ